jgi:hypothetical protein
MRIGKPRFLQMTNEQRHRLGPVKGLSPFTGAGPWGGQARPTATGAPSLRNSRKPISKIRIDRRPKSPAHSSPARTCGMNADAKLADRTWGVAAGSSASPHGNFAPQPRFVIQGRHARNHHFDCGLEKGGVFRSWAVPKGLPEDPAMKRLALRGRDPGRPIRCRHHPPPGPGSLRFSALGRPADHLQPPRPQNFRPFQPAPRHARPTQ